MENGEICVDCLINVTCFVLQEKPFKCCHRWLLDGKNDVYIRHIIFTIKIKIAWTWKQVHIKWRKVAAAIKSFVSISALICSPLPPDLPLFHSVLFFFFSNFFLSFAFLTYAHGCCCRCFFRFVCFCFANNLLLQLSLHIHTAFYFCI